LLNIAPAASATIAREALGRVHTLLAGLVDGEIPELEGQGDDGVSATARTFEDLTWLWGFGRRIFDSSHHDPPLTTAPRPEYLSYLPTEGEPFPKLPRAAGVDRWSETDVAIQFTASLQAAVNRAAVEVWKLIEDAGLPLSLVASFDGFGRPDGRGWLEFHDGVSNMAAHQRRVALEATGEPAWMAGGTYMVFLRCRLDLTAWRSLDRPDQELVVGRDKLSGNPVTATVRDDGGRIYPIAASLPVSAGAHLDPPQGTDPLIEASHIHRANQSRASPHAPAAWRIFRQGYDFLESIDSDGPMLGLNFVSFQASLASLQHILHLPGWLADVNFGGSARPAAGEPGVPTFVTVLDGGFYAVPPVAGAFPGASLFTAC